MRIALKRPYNMLVYIADRPERSSILTARLLGAFGKRMLYAVGGTGTNSKYRQLSPRRDLCSSNNVKMTAGADPAGDQRDRSGAA